MAKTGVFSHFGSTQLKTNTYVADIEKDKTEDASCSKSFNSKVDTTGGKTRLSCELNIVKGFREAII